MWGEERDAFKMLGRDIILTMPSYDIWLLHFLKLTYCYTDDTMVGKG